MEQSTKRVGLIAGGGRFPVIVAENLRGQGIDLVCAGVRHQASEELRELSRSFSYFGVGRLGRIIRFFKKHDVSEIALAGWLRKEELFRRWRLLSILPDWRLIKLYFFKVPDRQNQTLLAALVAEFEAEGIHVAHSTKFCPELLAEEGTLTRKKPTPKQEIDMAFGWKVAKRMADIDVGQSVVVHEKSTIAVEAIEGTDRNIRRAGEFNKRGGLVVVKVAKEGHDMRFDVPAVGPDTLDAMREAGCSVLLVEAGKTLFIDKEELVARADRYGLVIVALKEAPDAS